MKDRRRNIKEWKRQRLTMAAAKCWHLLTKAWGDATLMAQSKMPAISGELQRWNWYMTACFLSLLLPSVHLHPYTLTPPIAPLPVASSTKMTYVSYNNHAIWKGPRKRSTWAIGGGGASVVGQGQAIKRKGIRLSEPAGEGTNGPTAQRNPSMRHFLLFCIQPQRGGTS